MTSIARTAYPRFNQKLTDEELEKLYRPNRKELKFVRHYARGYRQQLTLMSLLKAHQNLGYIVKTKKIPKQIQRYLAECLGLSDNITLLRNTSANKKSFYRYHQSIREFLEVHSWSNGGVDIAKQVIEKTAYTMSDPADLINVAIEALLQYRYELPAFSTRGLGSNGTENRVKSQIGALSGNEYLQIWSKMTIAVTT